MYPLPELPLKPRMEDVERLQRVEPSVSLELSKDGVVRPVEPLWDRIVGMIDNGVNLMVFINATCLYSVTL